MLRSVGWVGVRSHRPATYAPPKRGAVLNWSTGSRARLIQALASVQWPEAPNGWVGITLTYPAKFGDAKQAKADLRAFRWRFERRFGPMVAVWKREYQRRGADHFHLLVKAPCAQPMLQRWAARAWHEVVGSKQGAHYMYGVRVQKLYSNAWQYLVGEMAGAKGYQERAPEQAEWVGRWWGVWNLTRWVEEVEVTEHEFYALRRQLRTLARKRRYHRRIRRQFEGLWLLSRAPARQLADALSASAALERSRGLRLVA